MSSELQPYARYTDSCVEWLGEVPEHWGVTKVKYIVSAEEAAIKAGPFGSQLTVGDMFDGEFKVYNQSNVISKDFTTGDNFVSREKYDELRPFQVHPDDLLLTARGTIGRVGILPTDADPGVLHPSLIRLRIDPAKIASPYLSVLFSESEAVRTQFAFRSNATTIQVIYTNTVENCIIPLPPLPEQHAIADYLDKETGRIDTLISEQRELIELLKEKRQALISHCVTRGLDPDVPMKDSGVEWLGEVPEHWTRARLGLIAKVTNGSTPSRERPEYWDDGTIPWVSSAEVNQGDIRTATGYITKEALEQTGLRLIPAGSVLIGLIGQGRTRGMSAILGLTACINQNVAAIEPADVALTRYIHHYLSHAYEPIRQLGRGGQQDALNSDIVRSIRILLPPLSEQQAIADYLDAETARIDALIKEAEETITLMQEHCSALISACVTGKVKVPGVSDPTAEEQAG